MIFASAAAFSVAPLAGAWIEINDEGIILTIRGVAPLAGAWIEMVSVHWTTGAT